MIASDMLASLSPADRARIVRERRSFAAEKGWARRRGEWKTYLELQGHAEVLPAFVRIATDLDGDTYWRLLGDIWSRGEGAGHDADVWRMIFGLHPEHRALMMSEAERATLAGLPDPLTIFRGGSSAGWARGFSWTLSRETAAWFARRCSRFEPVVAEGKVRRPHVIAYKFDRKEHEVVVLPEHVEISRVDPVVI